MNSEKCFIASRRLTIKQGTNYLNFRRGNKVMYFLSSQNFEFVRKKKSAFYLVRNTPPPPKKNFMLSSYHGTRERRFLII